jgi:ADP-heptose:LPS heptosyltransferase
VLAFSRAQWRQPVHSWWPAARSLAHISSHLRATKYDLVIDLHGQFRTALFTLASRAPVRIGFDRPRAKLWAALTRKLPAEAYKHAWKGAREGSWLAYTHRIRIATLDMHAVDRYLLLAPLLGLDNEPADFFNVIPASAEARVDDLLARSGVNANSGLVVLAPGTMWETKHWKTQGFAGVAEHFLTTGRPVVLIGARRDRQACAAVAAAVPGVVNLSEKTSLLELASLVRRAAVLVTNDSGPMHLAVALDRPVVSIFGPSDALWIGPYGRPDAVVSANLPCAPCYLRELRRCPHQHACMRDVSAEDVIARAELSLRRANTLFAAGTAAHS